MSKKRRHRKKTPTNFAVKKNSESDGINFYALVAGMVTTFLVILLIWSRFSTSQQTARALAATDESVGTSKAINNIDHFDFDTVLKKGTAQQLGNILYSYDEKLIKIQGIEFQILAERRRIAVANKMLQMNLASKERELAIKSKIEAMVLIHGLDHLHNLEGPNVTENLRKVASTYQRDANPNIALAARLSIFNLNVLEFPDFLDQTMLKELVEEFEKLNRDFPDHPDINRVIRTTMKTRFDSSIDHESTHAFVELLRKRVDVTQSPKLALAFAEFADQSQLIGSGLNDAYADRWANGRRGQAILLQTSLELAANPNSGRWTIAGLDKVAEWLEQIDQYESAKQIYNEILDHSAQLGSPTATELAQEVAKFGLQRNRILGKKIRLAGIETNGDKFVDSDFNDHVVIVCFWSAHLDASIRSLHRLLEYGGEWNRRPVKIIGVCVDEDHGDKFRSTIELLHDSQIVFSDFDDQGNIPIFDQCPSNRVPRIMLVGRDGSVVDTNIPILEVKQKVKSMLNATQ